MINKLILLAAIPLFAATFFYEPAMDYFLIYLCFVFFYFIFIVIKKILSFFMSILIVIISLAAASYFYVGHQSEIKGYFAAPINAIKEL